ncbi:MAG: glycosyltransferase family 4 protein [Bacteroidales bacterium]|nr:glycosyltransferase family 4 protein [Bacteroidales bacterium]
MKLFYCMASLYNPGGMERVLLNKVRWFASRDGYDVTVVTTDQQGRPPFYQFPGNVRMIDLGINYSIDNGRSPIAKILSYFQKRRKHRKALTELLMKERADIVASLYPSESSFIPKIKDGSKKVLELHLNRYFRLQYGRSGLLGLADRFRSWQDVRIARKFDRFVVLTKEDAGYWGNLPNLEVIPNAAADVPELSYDVSSRRVIAVGRLDYQKGFDRLIDAWSSLSEDIRKEWRLDIFGQGEWKEMLEERIERLGISPSARINPPTKNIFKEYASSAFIVMSSHYEGLPMVLIEAMSCGLPGVCFDFKCGPKDIIRNGQNGLLVPEGNIAALAKAMETIMRDESLRSRMSAEARKVAEEYSEKKIMKQWDRSFKELLA